MAYTDFSHKTIRHSWGRFTITLGAACAKGDLLARDGTLADANANKPAYCVALQPGASGDKIQAAKGVEAAKPGTMTAAGDHSGVADDVLWLSATAGGVSATPVANIAQKVGVCLDTERIVLEPAEAYDPRAELVAAAKTLDEQDAGKQMYLTADAVVITLPAGSAAPGLNFVIVNGMNDGACLVTVSPAAADKITGNDRAGVNNKDVLNTKATARCGDRIEIISDGVATNAKWYVTKEVGTWAAEA